jgi:hypothetical protein
MFYLTPSFPVRGEQLIVGAVLSSLVLVVGCLALGASPAWIAAAALPGAAFVWVVHPTLALVAIARRRRRRSDPSLDFWRAGLACSACLLPLGALAVLADDSRYPVLFGWVLLWGWAATIVHGMLMRIVPFLVWFHRLSSRVGREPVPTLRQLLPDRFARVGFVLHVGTLLSGVAAIATGASLVARLTGAGLALTGAALLRSMTHVLAHPAVRSSGSAPSPQAG